MMWAEDRSYDRLFWITPEYSDRFIISGATRDLLRNYAVTARRTASLNGAVAPSDDLLQNYLHYVEAYLVRNFKYACQQCIFWNIILLNLTDSAKWTHPSSGDTYPGQRGLLHRRRYFRTSLHFGGQISSISLLNPQTGCGRR